MSFWQLASHIEKNEIRFCLIPQIKINSQWTKYLNVKEIKTVKLVEKNIGEYLYIKYDAKIIKPEK